MQRTLLIAAALLALIPLGPAERLADLGTLPARVAAAMGLPATALARVRTRPGTGADDEALARESELSMRLERAVLRSAWPVSTPLDKLVDPIPGEVDARLGRGADMIRVRVAAPERVRVGQPVVAGDVYIGRVSRIPFREPVRDDPGPLERLMRAMGLSSPPLDPPRDAIDVALVTGRDQRVGGLVLEDQDGQRCAMVVGGVLRSRPSVRLAVHAPERRATSEGRVVVSEPLGLEEDFEKLGNGFLIGELRREQAFQGDSPMVREVLGIQPAVDFRAGLNQVLVLAGSHGPVDHLAARQNLPVTPVLEDGGWAPARVLVTGDTMAWRSTLRLDLGSRDGLASGAALVEGVRLVGRVSDPRPLTSAVATLGDPGFRINALAQAVDAPDEAPLAMGVLTSAGRAADGRLLLRWSPVEGTHWPAWARDEQTPGARRAIAVTLWTGSGMARVPRGLLIGRTTLPVWTPGVEQGDPASASPEGAERALDRHILAVSGAATQRGPFQVRLGGARVARPAPASSQVQAAEVPR